MVQQPSLPQRRIPYTRKPFRFCVLLTGLVVAMFLKFSSASQNSDAFTISSGARFGTHQQQRFARVQAHSSKPGGLAEVVVEQKDPFNGGITRPFSAPGNLCNGQVLVHIVKFSMTANTLTYATMGKMPFFATWSHFPSNDHKYAKSPAWGMGVVNSSRCASVPVGTRIFGYFPMSPSVVLRPTDVNAEGFFDGVFHRKLLLNFYSKYEIREPPKSADIEDLGMADGLLFGVGWAIAQEVNLRSYGSQQKTLLLISASSRTALGAAFTAKHEKMGYRVIGLTSRANEAYVNGTGFYDTVCTYDAIGTLPKESVAIYDMAGSAKVQEELRAHYGKDVVSFNIVGGSHVGSSSWSDLQVPVSALPFPLPTLFSPFHSVVSSVPPLTKLLDTGAQYITPYASWMAHGGARPDIWIVFTAFNLAEKEYGQATMKTMMKDARDAYETWKLPKSKIERCYGADATLGVWRLQAAGEADPGTTYICSLWPEGQADPQLKTH